MTRPTLPLDGDNPWGAILRNAINQVSDKADSGSAAVTAAQTELTGVHNTVNANSATISGHETRITSIESSSSTGLPSKANASATVNLTGAQTIAGTKTFSSAPVVPANSFAIAAINGLQTALNAKAALASPTFTGTVGGLDKTMVALANVDNTSDATKPVSAAQQAALDLKADSTDLTTAIQTHTHTGGTDGANLPIAAVTSLQAALDGKQAGVRTATLSGTAITFDNTAWTIPFCWGYRFGPVAYVFMQVTTKNVIPANASGNIGNVTIGTINSTSEFSHVFQGTGNANLDGMYYSLSTTATGVLAAGYVDYNGTIGLSATMPTTSWGGNIPVGTNFTLAGVFLLDNVTG